MKIDKRRLSLSSQALNVSFTMLADRLFFDTVKPERCIVRRYQAESFAFFHEFIVIILPLRKPFLRCLVHWCETLVFPSNGIITIIISTLSSRFRERVIGKSGNYIFEAFFE